MDYERLGYWIIIGINVSIVWTFRKQFYALYLDSGVKIIFSFIFAPFVYCYKFAKMVKVARDEWAEEIIEEHKSSRQTDANS